MYNGYWESEHMKEARAIRRMNEFATHLILSTTSEAEADELAACIIWADSEDIVTEIKRNTEWLDDGCGNDSDMYDWSRGG